MFSLGVQNQEATLPAKWVCPSRCRRTPRHHFSGVFACFEVMVLKERAHSHLDNCRRRGLKIRLSNEELKQPHIRREAKLQTLPADC